MSNLELNKGDNFIHVIDVSASMQERDAAGGLSRIDAVKETVITNIREASKWDTDGNDVLTFGHKVTPYLKVSTDRAADIVGALQAKESSTDTAGAIAAAWKLHRDGGYAQSVAFIYTDGAPSDEDAVFKEVAGITEKLKDPHEFALSFLTVGVRSAALEAFLAKLDDGVPGAKEDIVDVKRLEEVDFLAAFAGALHD